MPDCIYSKMVETPTETRWCWWTFSYEQGHWMYLFNAKTNKVASKIFIWHWEEEEEKKCG